MSPNEILTNMVEWVTQEPNDEFGYCLFCDNWYRNHSIDCPWIQANEWVMENDSGIAAMGGQEKDGLE